MARLRPAVVPAALALAATLPAQDPQDPEDPEVQRLRGRVETLETKVDVLLEELESRPVAAAEDLDAAPSWTDRFTLGGYGETHLNFVEGSDDDIIDNHRFVLYLGYAFADWIQLNSETEIEHSFVDDGDGEISIEQLHTDFLLSEPINVRIGRYLVPMGIVNKTHEPPTFFGVERPSVDRVIIPTTWSQDGIGLFGRLGERVAYEVYVGSGLSGDGFDDLNGIRGGRLKERPGIDEPGFTGRVDVRPLEPGSEHDLRLGTSFFASRLGNRDQGASAAPGTLHMYSADAQWRWDRFEARAVYAIGFVDDASDLSAFVMETIGNRIEGWYVEGAWHFLPDSWLTGKLRDADAAVFARWEEFDTQDHVPAGLVKNGNAERDVLTVGLSFFPVPNLVLKADYQFRDDADGDLADLWNFGIGWMF